MAQVLFSVGLLLLASILHLTSPCLARKEFSVLPRPAPGSHNIVTKKYAKIPNFEGKPSRIVGITGWDNKLYVCTSVSGGIIYEVSKKGIVKPWFNVGAAMSKSGRSIEFQNVVHGGIRSIAFHPQHSRNGLFYVALLEARVGPPSDYRYLSRPRDQTDSDSVVYEWGVNEKTGKPLGKTMREVIRVGLHHYDHPIKQMTFKGQNLYIGHGDGSIQSPEVGGGFENDGLGKIICINPLRKGLKPYSIPAGNPFKKNDRYKSEIYAIGFRNPHNLCFSREKGDLFVADAGRDNVEEIDIVRAGGNYGWPEREGPFVHREVGGLGTGIRKLPRNDDENRYRYPNAAVGHVGNKGWTFKQAGQAISASCPVENGSDLDGLLLYCNFPTDGALYYSTLKDLRDAVVMGKSDVLRMAKSYQMKVLFDHDDKKRSKPQAMRNLREIVEIDWKISAQPRADVRFGQGTDGELYWSSKSTGWIYIITNSVPKSRCS